MKKIFAALLLCASGGALAYSPCGWHNDLEGVPCLSQEYQRAERELNERYSSLTLRLDNRGREQLERSQQAWKKARVERCTRREGNSVFVDLDCGSSQALTRTRFLKERLDECYRSGCINERLKERP
ncbi:lysozyme inhibitor LprI family protein [Duganella sp. HH105]|uniref:lysozyme inhibitor LprI family protein n=1 Tax=Duganella sp. HH105 TaxID=1781067 RepID=UPI000877C1D8|nr:lysozyme inhibitor LprI family protein [Duganella sp. HH105]OEZ56515.1 hypothetical protein DUGA6_49670 [Duganella sp. HH105]